MSCPFDKDSLDKLKAFIDICSGNPQLLHLPQLDFFKKYLESLGVTIPVAATPTMESTESTTRPQEKSAENVEEVESDPESELELDLEGCIEPDTVDPNQVMGDSSKVPSEEDADQADEKRIAAMSEFSEGNYQKAVELFTEAITLNPTLAVLYVKRGQTYLKLKKPNACIKDCTQALELNPDSAAGYKFRGRAYRLIGNWEDAAKDLRQACKIDFDEQADEWLKEVTPNAQKIEQHRLKQERKKADKEEKERAERIRKAREAHTRAAQADAQAHAETGASEGFGGGGGGAGAGAAGMGDFYKLLQDPEVMAAFKDPEVAAAFQDISTNPANFVKYQSNPKVMALISKLSSKFQGSGMGFPGMGMGMGGFPGAGGFGRGPTGGGQAKPSEDFGLD